jgi:arginyl-tRNA synthetase
MKIKISSKILKFFPGIQYTVILIKNIDNSRKISNISQLLRGSAVVAKNELKKADKKGLFSQVAEVALEDGSTFLESYLLSSRMKKVLAGKDLEGKNNLLNFTGFISLKFFLPLHGFDLDQAEQDHSLDFYLPKKGKKSPELDFLPETRNLVLWFPNLVNWSEEEIDHFIDEINLNLNKYLHTKITEVYHLDSEHPEVDLGYQSEKEKQFLEQKAEEDVLAPVFHKSSIGEKNLSETPVIAEISPDLPTETRAESVKPAARLQQILIDIVAENFPELSSLDTPQDLSLLIEVEIPKDSARGDYSSNIAMKLAKILNQPPQQLADRLVTLLQNKQADFSDLVSRIEAASPGFINFYLSPNYFQNSLQEILKLQDRYGHQDIGHGQKIMIEFGSLNIAKPFGAHHFLTTVIGQTLVNLYKVLNFQVLSADHPGDWGTQFGKSIYAYKKWGDQDTVEKDPINEMLKLYVRFHTESEVDKSLEDAAREEFLKLEQGDPENLHIWQWLVEISIKDLNQIYQTMGVKHDRRYGEAKYNQACQELLAKGKQLGIFVEGEKGAYIANLEEEKLPPALVQKGDGTSLYITRDLASIEDRLNSETDLKELIYVVDSAQTLHFKQLFAVAARLHEADKNFPICKFRHVPYGRMNFADSSMSTRKGNVILGVDLIKESTQRSEKLLQDKLGPDLENFSAPELKNLTHGLALGAIKYAMLSQAPESDFTFDWDKVLSFEGNSAPYLQYSLTRAQSILRKTSAVTTSKTDSPAKSPSAIDQTSLFSLEEIQKAALSADETAAAESTATPFGLPAEQALLRLLPLFPDKVTAAALQFKPHTLTNYLHELAQAFNSFYGSVPVLKTQRQDLLEARLNLVHATVQVLKNGLQIIGIAIFERM